MRDWEDHWQRGETPWEKGGPAPPLLEYLEEWDNGSITGSTILVPGCGSGHDVRALAAAGARVTGLDIAPTAIELAGSIPRVNGERYRQGSFFEWRDEAYDAIWEHTCFCAIDPSDRDRYAAAAARLVKPGGRLIGVFYLDPDHDEDGPPFGATRDEISRHLAPSFSLVREKVPQRSFPTREGREWLVEFRRLA